MKSPTMNFLLRVYNGYKRKLIFVFSTIIVAGVSNIYGQENTLSPQPLPYFMDFGTDNTTYAYSYPGDNPLYSKGIVAIATSGNGYGRATNRAKAEAATFSIDDDVPALSSLPSTDRFNLYQKSSNDVSLLMGAGSSKATALLLSTNTSGYSNLKISYQITYSEDDGANKLYGNILQYRLGNSGAFTSIEASLFESTATGIGLNSIVGYNLTIPGSLDNQSEVQFRWVNWFPSGFPSILIDNISVSGILLPAVKLNISSILPTDKYTDSDLSAVISSINTGGVVSPVTENTEVILSVGSSNSTLSGNYTGIIPSGESTITIAGFKLTSGTVISLVASTLSGNTLLSSNPSIPFDVNLPLPAYVVSITSVASLFSNFTAGQPFTAELKTYSNIGTPGAVLSNTVLSLTGIGVSLGGNTLVTISGGFNTISVTGLVFLSSATGASIGVVTVSGDAINGSSYSNSLTIKSAPSVFTISLVAPGGVAKNTPFSLVVTASNLAGETLPLSSNLALTLSKASGNGNLNFSSASIVYGAYSTTITGLKYNVAENGVSLSVSAAGFTTATTPTFAVVGSIPPSEGFTYPAAQALPYFQDWGTNPDTWVDGADDDPSTHLLPVGLVGLRGTGSSGSPLPSRTIDDATSAVYSANNFIGGGASMSPVTLSGQAAGLELFRSNTRANGILLAVKTGGYESIQASYSLTLTTSTDGAYFGVAFEYRIGSAGLFNTLNVFESNVGNVSINTPINYIITLPSSINNQSNVQFRWVYWNNSAAAGAVLDNISISGTRTDYIKIVKADNTPVVAGTAAQFTITAYDKTNNIKNVSQPTVLQLSGNGLTATTATITGGSSTATVGLTFNKGVYNTFVEANAIAGDPFGGGATDLFNVSGVVAGLKIVKVLPEGNIVAGKPITVRVKLVDADGNTAISASAISVTISSTATGFGTLSGTLSGIAAALTDSIIDIKPLFFSNSIKHTTFVAAANELSSAISDTFNIYSDPSAGLTYLYKEDFENTNPAIKGPNGNYAAIPSNMKMFNVDNQLSTASSGYPKYGRDAYVMIRRSGKGLTPLAADDELQYTKDKVYYFNNSGSAYPDSNWVAAATSFFTDDQTITADRWLVTPPVSLGGANLTLSLQALSGTSSGNYEDLFQVLFTDKPVGNSIVSGDWEAFNVKNAVLGTDSITNSAPTVPNNYFIKLPETFNGATVSFAVRLVTGKVYGSTFGGDRLYVDNIFVTSGFSTSVKEELKAETSLAVFPNPATESLTLSFNAKSTGATTLSYYAASGLLVAEENLGTIAQGPQFIRKDISALLPGLYILKLQTPSGVQFAKFFKE